MTRPTLATLFAATSLLAPAAAQTGITLVNGVDGYLEVPYSPAVVPQTGITIEAWLTYDDATLGTGWRYPTVCRQNITPQQESYFLRVNANNTAARTLTWKVVGSNGVAKTCNWAFGAGQLLTWTHVAATYDGTTANLFVNGAQVATATGTQAPIWDRGGVLRIGKGDDSGGPIEVWNGSLDEVRLWPFARTAAEIQQTMNLRLDSLAGGISTWNLDNHLLDTSGSLHATSTGSVAFTANPLNLGGFAAPVAFHVGVSTPGCLGALRMALRSVPSAGNLDFAVSCTQAPANATAFGAIALSAATAPLAIAGIDYWLDPSSSVILLSSASASGVARTALPLPAWIGAGQSFAFQMGFLDPCGPLGATASDAVIIVTQ